MLVKVLGGIDLACAFAFLLMTFGLEVMPQYSLFCAGLLFVKGLFIFSGDVLSAIDLGSSVALVISVFTGLPVVFLWIPAFLLTAKGFVSFL